MDPHLPAVGASGLFDVCDECGQSSIHSGVVRVVLGVACEDSASAPPKWLPMMVVHDALRALQKRYDTGCGQVMNGLSWSPTLSWRESSRPYSSP